MPTQINGSTGVSQVQDGVVTSTKIVDGAVTPAKTQVGVLPSMIRLAIHNGFGSVATMIRRFATLITSQGADITYTDSATQGASFTINTNGIYSIAYGDCFTGVGWMGISVNASSLVTQINALTVSEILAVSSNLVANSPGNCSWCGYLPAGSVIRAHCQNGLTAGSGSNPTFSISRVA